MREISFVQTYGGMLREAHEACRRYRASGDRGYLEYAWEVYYKVSITL